MASDERITARYAALPLARCYCAGSIEFFGRVDLYVFRPHVAGRVATAVMLASN